MTKNMKELIGNLKDVMPNGTHHLVGEQEVCDVEQFISDYLYLKKQEMLKMYPHREKFIETAYDHVLCDMKTEHSWLTEEELTED